MLPASRWAAGKMPAAPMIGKSRYLLLSAAIVFFIAPYKACGEAKSEFDAGVAALRKGQYAEARRLLLQSLKQAEKPGASATRLAECLTYLGDLNQAQAQYGQSESFYKRAIAVSEKKGSSAGSLKTWELRKLARLYEVEAEYKSALPLMKQVVASDKESLKPDSLQYAMDLHDYGRLNYIEGNRDAGALNCNQALAIFRKISAKGDTESAIAMDKLATTYRRQCRDLQSEPLYKKALEIEEKNQSYLDQIDTLDNLGRYYKQRGKYAQAMGCYKNALAISEKTLGANNLRMPETLNLMGHAYMSQQKYEEAESFFKRALSIRESVWGADHPDVARSLCSLGALYCQEEEYDLAEDLFSRALSIYDKTLPANHPLVFSCLKDYALTLRKTDRSIEASKLDERARAITYKQPYDGR